LHFKFVLIDRLALIFGVVALQLHNNLKRACMKYRLPVILKVPGMLRQGGTRRRKSAVPAFKFEMDRVLDAAVDATVQRMQASAVGNGKF
jgi:hypothetical protein